MIKQSKNLFLKGLSSSYLQFGIVTIVGLWLTPYVLTFLSKAEYGVFAIFIDLIAWIALIEVTNGIMQSKLAHYYATGNLDEAKKLASSAFWSQAVVAILILIVSIALSFNLELVVDLKEPIPYLKEAFILIGIASAVDIVGRTYASIMVASKKIYIDNYINIFIFLFRVSLIVLFLQEGYQILSLAIANLITSIISVCIKLYKVHKLGFSFPLHPRNISIEKISFLYSNGKWFMLGSLAGLLIFNIDRIIAGKVLGLETVTVYVITLKLYDLSEKMLSKVISISRPFIGDLYAKKEYRKLSELFVFMDQTYTFIVWGVGFGVLVISHFFIEWWVGSGFYGGDVLSYFMFLNFVLQAMVMPKRAYLASTLYEVKKQNIARALEGVMNLVLSLIFVHYFGLVGLVLGSALATLLGSNLTYSYYVRNLLKYNGFPIHYSNVFWVTIGIIFSGSIFLLLLEKLHSYLFVIGIYILYIGMILWYLQKYLIKNEYMDYIVKKLKL